MAIKRSTKKNTSSQNQPPSGEVTNSQSNKPLEFPTFDPLERYSPNISSHSTLVPTYTSSLDTSNPNLDSSLNEELCGLTPDDPVLLVPNNEVNQLYRHTYAYPQSIGQIPVIYQIPRACSSHRRTQTYGENETLASCIDDFS